MSDTYEIRLENEFGLLQKLAKDLTAKNYIGISYQERYGSSWKSILVNPNSGERYPEKFKVTYKYPIMYVGPRQVVENWEYSFYFVINENILLHNGAIGQYFFAIDNGEFPDGYIPYNSHVSKAWVCIGSEWEASKGLGIWYFVLSMASLLNQDKAEMNINETVHLNGDAYDYWVEERNMKPNNEIRWPFNLLDKSSMKIKPLDESSMKIKEITSGMKIREL